MHKVIVWKFCFTLNQTKTGMIKPDNVLTVVENSFFLKFYILIPFKEQHQKIEVLILEKFLFFGHMINATFQSLDYVFCPFLIKSIKVNLIFSQNLMNGTIFAEKYFLKSTDQVIKQIVLIFDFRMLLCYFDIRPNETYLLPRCIHFCQLFFLNQGK